MDNQLEKLNKLIALLQDDTVKASDIERFLLIALDTIQKSKDSFNEISQENLNKINDALELIKKNHSELLLEVSTETSKLKKDFTTSISKLEKLAQEIKDYKPLDGQDGKDADETKIIEEVLSKLPKPKEVKLDDASQIKDKLETLKGEKRLDISAIKGADKLSTKDNLDRAISILDQRTQFLINKQNASSGGGTPGGSTTQLQYNNAGAFGGISGATTDGTSVTYTTGNLKAADIKASSSAGLQILSNAGTVTALFGAGGGANSTFYGGLKADYATASTIAIFDASKNLISADTATYPSLTELSYVKGVTSAIQTQLNAKESALTFSTGLTRTSNTITNNLSTGVSGGQTVYGGTGSGNNLVLQSTTNATRGNVKIDTTSGGFNFRDYLGSIPAMYPGSNVTAGSDAFILASFGTTSMFYGSGGAASLYHFVSGANRTVLTSTYYNIGVNTSIGLALGTTPSAKLHLESGTAELQTMGASILLNQKWLGVNTVGLRIYQTPDAGNQETGRMYMNFWNGSSATLGVTMEFATLQRSTLTLTTRMVIDNLGQVGIGTTSGVDATSKLEVRTNSLGTTQTTSSGLALTNTTAAAAGAQQISPAIRWSGKGWKTDATAASRDVDFRSYVVPVQGAANPTGYLTFESSINGAAYSEVARVTNTGVFTTTAGIISGGTIRLKGYTVATLPAGTVGDTAYVTDALAPAFLATVVGGGAVTTPVFFDGTNWVGY